MCAECDKLERRMSGHLRFATIAWLIAVPFMYATVFWAWSNREFGPERNWRGLFAIPVVFPVLKLTMFRWLCRNDLRNAKLRLHPEDIPLPIRGKDGSGQESERE